MDLRARFADLYRRHLRMAYPTMYQCLHDHGILEAHLIAVGEQGAVAFKNTQQALAALAKNAATMSERQFILRHSGTLADQIVLRELITAPLYCRT